METTSSRLLLDVRSRFGDVDNICLGRENTSSQSLSALNAVGRSVDLSPTTVLNPMARVTKPSESGLESD